MIQTLKWIMEDLEHLYERWKQDKLCKRVREKAKEQDNVSRNGNR